MGVPHLQAFLIPHQDWDTDADNLDFQNGTNLTNTTNIMPWAGVIGRVLIGHSDTIGDGNVGITQWPNGVNVGDIENPEIPFTSGAGAGVVIVDVDQPFNKDDGIVIRLDADTLQDRATRITVEVEFAFV